MDETTAAILALTKEIGDLKGVVGGLDGRTAGIGREIGDLKALVAGNNTSCSRCKEEIYASIEKIDNKVEDLREHGAAISQQNARDIEAMKKKQELYDMHCNGEQAVETSWDKFWNNSVARWGTVAALALVCIGWILQWKGIL